MDGFLIKRKTPRLMAGAFAWVFIQLRGLYLFLRRLPVRFRGFSAFRIVVPLEWIDAQEDDFAARAGAALSGCAALWISLATIR